MELLADLQEKNVPLRTRFFKVKLCVVLAGLWMIPSVAEAQPLLGQACPDAAEILELNDLLFSSGYLCKPLDSAFHAAYDPWETTTGPAPFRSEAAGVAATIRRLVVAGDFDAASLQLVQMPQGALRDAVDAGITQSRAQTVEALFVRDDRVGQAFRLASGFDWEGAQALMAEILANDSEVSEHEARQVFQHLILGAVLGASEREAEPMSSIGWTQLPLWTPQTTAQELEALLVELEPVVANWGGRAILYLRLAARQLGFTRLNQDLFANYYADACRPHTDWPQAVTASLALVLDLDEGCGGVADLALRNWEQAAMTGLPIPAWSLDHSQ